MDQTQAQLDAHERECAIRYASVQDKLDALDKRLWRLEGHGHGVDTLCVVVAAATVFMQ